MRLTEAPVVDRGIGVARGGSFWTDAGDDVVASARHRATMLTPWVSAMRGPTPETCSNVAIVLGQAMTMLWRTASEKTMKAGLPVLAASILRQLRRAASRDLCSEV